MKFVNILASAAIVAAFASCSCNKSADNQAQDNAEATEQCANQDSTACTAGAEQSAEAAELAAAPVKKGTIKEINGNDVTIATDGEDIVVTIENPSEELIEGSPIEIKYKEVDGKLVAYQGGVKVPGFKYTNLLGKWATEGNKITMELRKRGRANSIGQQNIEFKHWDLTGDSITFQVKAASGQEFSMPWAIETNDVEKLVLTNGTSKLDMTRLDANRE
ncbi:MAG: lipocalin family protein [Bacteroidales bacterium]|nr:lipocalin family protein [Bacteroidales bacterium]